MGLKYSSWFRFWYANMVVAGLGVGLSPQKMPARVGTIKPEILLERSFVGKVLTLELGRHYVTSIRLPEAVSSIAIGDPSLFKVEHAEQEPQLLFIKPIATEAVECNLLVSTSAGKTFCFLLRSSGPDYFNAWIILPAHGQEKCGRQNRPKFAQPGASAGCGRHCQFAKQSGPVCHPFAGG